MTHSAHQAQAKLTAASLVHELMEARDEKRLMRLQRQLAKVKLLIIDELGFVPLSKTGAELLFELISQRYECGSTLITSNLPFEEWTETFGTERLTGALLDRLTHHVNILEMNGESYRLNQSRVLLGHDAGYVFPLKHQFCIRSVVPIITARSVTAPATRCTNGHQGHQILYRRTIFVFVFGKG